jgi:uncharacterized protein with beta-barrel porin domain
LFLATLATTGCLSQVPVTHAEDWDYSASNGTISSNAEYANIKNFEGGATLNITLENAQTDTTNYRHVILGTAISPPKILDNDDNDVTNGIKNVNIDLQSQYTGYGIPGTVDDYTDLIFGGNATSSNTKAGSASWTVKEGDTFTVTNSTAAGHPGESVVQFGGGYFGDDTAVGGDGSFTVNGGDVKFENGTELRLGGWGKVGGKGTFTMTGGNADISYLGIGGIGDYDPDNNNSGTGKFTMSGGTLKASYIGIDGDNSVFNLSGGTLTIDNSINVNGDNSNIKQTGGTLQASHISLYGNNSEVNLSGGTLTIDRSIGAYGQNSNINLTGGNLTLVDVPYTDWNNIEIHGVEVYASNQINIGANAKVTIEGSGHSVEANQINVAGGTFAFDVSTLTADDSTAAVTLNANQLGLLDKFKVELLADSSTATGTYNLVSTPYVDLTGKVDEVLVNDRLGLSIDSIDTTSEKLKVTINNSGTADANSYVATWNPSNSNAIWGESSGSNWELEGNTASHGFKNNDQVKFENGTAGVNQNITVASAGVTVKNQDNNNNLAMSIDSDTDYTFAGGSITSTSGDFEKSGRGTVTIENEVDFTGQKFALTEGETVIDGLVTAQNVTVSDGATLSGGNGANAVIVGDLTFNEGAWHKPGHSPGTFVVGGNINYNAGSMIYLDFGKDASATDLVKAINGGNINFAADGNTQAVQVAVGNSGKFYVDDGEKTNTVFEATGEIQLNGTAIAIDNHTADNNKITIDDDSDHKIVFSGVNGINLQSADVLNGSKELTLTAKGTYIPLPSNITPNQKSLYDSLDTADDISTFANRLKAYISLSDGDAAQLAAIEAALPTVNSALFVASQRNVVSANRSISNRLHFLQDRQPRVSGFALRDGDVIFRGQNSACDPCGVYDPCGSFTGLGNGSLTANTWFEGFGDFLRQSNTDHLQGYRSNVGGFNLGVDQQLNRHLILGVSFGGAYADMKTNDLSQWGNVEQYLFSIYGSRSWDDWTFSFSGGYAYSDYDLTRHPGNVEIRSEHNGDQYFASFELARKMRFAKYDLTPFYALDFIRLEEEGYDERDAFNTVVSSIDAQNSDSYLQTIGVKFGRSRRWHGWIVNPTVTAGWVHDYGSGNVYTTAQYAGGSKFTIKGAAINKNRGLIGANLNIATSPNLTIYGGYNGEFAGRFQVQSVQAGLNYMF